MNKRIVPVLLCIVISFLAFDVYAADWSAMSSGTTNNINGVWGTSGSNVFAVGDGGTILHYDGITWAPMASHTTNNLNGVWGTSATHAYAVGDNGTILHYDGTSWDVQVSPVTNNLNRVWGFSNQYAYAVGDNGTLLFNNGSWTVPMPPGTFSVNLNSVWGRSASDVFVVGNGGTIAHFGGSPPGGFMDSGTIENLYGVWGGSSGGVFAVGANGTLLYYNGISWTAPMPPGTFSTSLNSIWGRSGSDVFVVGDGGIIAHFGGSPPGGFMDSGTIENLHDVWGSSGADVFAVGAKGTILYYSALPDDSCNGRCGAQAPAGCWCNEACHEAGVCCPDKCTFCSSPLCGQQCRLSINPPFAQVPILGMVQFNAMVDGTCNDPCFTWEISLQESTGSTINQNGLYTAGGNRGTDVVQAADPCNGNISASAIASVGTATTTTVPPPANDNLQDLLMYYAHIYSSPQIPTPLFTKKVVAKAEPDECYNGIGNPYPPGPPCSEGQPKVNQAYVWGLTQQGNVWMGTAPNVLCLVFGGILGSAGTIEAPSFVCELGESQLVPPLPDMIGDWRPPKIYEYNPLTQDLLDRTPLAGPLINRTLGLRSAGSLHGVIFLAGPGLGTGINMFAYKSDGTFLGAKNFSEYNDIRKWIAVEGVLYTAVQNTAGGGTVLKWIDNPASPAYPFQFEAVGNLDTEGSNLALHEGRLFATTWPAVLLGGQPSSPISLYMSPAVPPGGLTAADANSWVKVWRATDYEPDNLVVRTYAGGDLVSFDGTLFWGTMHVPFLATQAALKLAQDGMIGLDPAGDGLGVDDLLTTALGTHRAVSIFAGRNFGTPEQQIELLYGDQYLPVYDPVAQSYTIARDARHQNRMPNPVPKYGPSGIGNFFNTYTWTMGAGFENTPGLSSLLVGTFDWSYVLEQMIIALIRQQAGQNPGVYNMTADQETVKDFIAQLPAPGFGADLFVARSAHEPFMLESNDGQGNYLSYGIRTMLPSALPPAPQGIAGQTAGKDIFYLGMANPFNLATDPAKPQGGWELIQLCASPQACGENFIFDIRPDTLDLHCQGVLPAAILGNEEFDVTLVDPDSLRLSRKGINSGVTPLRYKITANATPYHADMLLKFSVPEFVETLLLDEVAWQTIPLTLTGTTFDGTPIRGQDSVFLLGGIDIECLCDFDCDADVDGTDALAFKRNFGRGTLRNPCTEEDPCDGDLDSDADVDGNDAFTFKGSYGTVLYRPQ